MPVLATKLYLPSPRPDIIPRPRLIHQLNEGLAMGRKLTLISASAGFGKTTLVSEWGAALQSPDREAAFGQLAASAGLTGTDLPSEMAFINEVLDNLPDALCNVFLVNYFNDLYT